MTHGNISGTIPKFFLDFFPSIISLKKKKEEDNNKYLSMAPWEHVTRIETIIGL